jgi:ribosomal protein L37AE/L43A
MVKNYVYHHYKKYVLNENYTVPEPYRVQVLSIIKYIKKHNEKRESAAKRLGVSESTLKKMITFWNSNHKNESPKLEVNTTVRLRNSCPVCSAISIVRRKSSDWRCERCDAHFQVPAQREYEYKYTSLPRCLIAIMENKGK